MGRFEHAQRLGNRALGASRHQPGFEAHAHLLLGDIAALSESWDAQAGEIHFRDALAVADKLWMHPLAAHSQHGLGKIYRGIGRPDRAREQFTAATAMYREMDMRFWVEQTEIELRDLH